MTHRTWVRLDNASNIFLAARTDADPKVFRISAELDHEVDPALLQEALDATYDRYPLYHAVLRRGVFWYYLQDSDLRPLVAPETQYTCAPLYHDDRRSLLFRVLHHRQRIILEIFHALSDGTGALWFLTDLVSAYVHLRHPEQAPPEQAPPEQAPPEQAPPEQARTAAGTTTPAPRHPAPPVGDDDTATPHGLIADSFAHYFRRRRRRETADGAAFGPDAAPQLTLPTTAPPAPSGPAPARGRVPRRPSGRVHRVRGTRTPDNRTRAVELTMPAADVLALARAEGVALTMFLTALFFESIRRSAGDLGATRTLAASVPVNLRQFFPSTSARNFFATVRVQYTYGHGDDDLGSICRALELQFRPQATAPALERKLRSFIRFERMPGLRIVPRPLKDVILRLINGFSNRGLSVAVSNLGLVRLPDPIDAQVGRMLFHVSAARPQFCAMSHAGMLAVTFTSPFVETGHIREFARQLSSRGVDVRVAAARVTETELAERAT